MPKLAAFAMLFAVMGAASPGLACVAYDHFDPRRSLDADALVVARMIRHDLRSGDVARLTFVVDEILVGETPRTLVLDQPRRLFANGRAHRGRQLIALRKAWVEGRRDGDPIYEVLGTPCGPAYLMTDGTPGANAIRRLAGFWAVAPDEGTSPWPSAFGLKFLAALGAMILLLAGWLRWATRRP